MQQTRYYFEKEFEEYRDILSSYPHTAMRFRKNEYLVKPGELFALNHYIISGLVKISVLHESGEERILSFCGPGSIYPIIANEKPFVLEDKICVQAAADTVTWTYPFAMTRSIMQKEPEIACTMIDHYCRMTNFLFYELTSESCEDLRTRICNILLVFCENSKSSVVPLSQSELSSLVGAVRSSAVRVLKDLREGGLIETQRSSIRILDMDALRQQCSTLVTE